jgi:catechol 2,3-dioxygenase-like lactoylglutathione lyase family enzyme
VLTSVDHVIIGVRDLDAATASYQTLLGRRPSWHGDHPGLGTANVLFRLENSYLELLAPVSDGLIADQLSERLHAHGEGVVGVAFGTEDAASAAAELRGRGLAVNDPADGKGRDEITGAVRTWLNVMFPLETMRGIFAFAIEHRSAPDALPRAACTGDETAAISALDHIVILTRDPEASKAIYGDILGIRLALDKSFEQFGARLLFFRIGGVTVELAARLGAEPAPDEPDRFGGLAYRVQDVTAAQARLAEAGFDVSEVRKGRKEGTVVCTVHNPTHGVPTLLIGPA